MNRGFVLIPLALSIVSQGEAAESPVACNEILKKNGAFDLVVSDSSKSAQEFTYEWLRTATWEDFKKKQDAGLKVVLPIKGVPVEADGTYTEDEFRTFTELRNEGKLRNFSEDEFERSVKLTASQVIADAWLECMRIKQDPRGMTCWPDSDDRMENGVVVFKARYFPITPRDNIEPTVSDDGGLKVDGGEVVEPNPLGPGKTIPFGGVSVQIKRNKTSSVTVSLNSTESSCGTVQFPAIPANSPPPFNIQIFSQVSAIQAHPEITVGLPAG